MIKSQIKIGRLVWYYPVKDEPKREEAKITSDVFEICGKPRCMIDIRLNAVDIENLELRKKEKNQK